MMKQHTVLPRCMSMVAYCSSVIEKKLLVVSAIHVTIVNPTPCELSAATSTRMESSAAPRVCYVLVKGGHFDHKKKNVRFQITSTDATCLYCDTPPLRTRPLGHRGEIRLIGPSSIVF